jgi:hypothetical protein
MIELGPARESNIVLAFLRAEIDYSNLSQGIQQNLGAFGMTRRELIDNADLANDYQNAVRAVLLDSYRGYLRRTLLFTGFPKDVEWRRVELEHTDLDRLRYIAKEEHWDMYSEGTRQPKRVVDKIARGDLPDLAQKVGAIQEKLRCGETLPELVAVEGKGTDLILIEGAHRTTAYMALRWSTNVAAFIGCSPHMSNWHFYEKASTSP